MKTQIRFTALAISSAIALLIVSACRKPLTVENEKQIKINYALNVDGVQIDPKEGMAPMTYVQGSHQIIPGLEEQLLGLKVGDKKHVVVTPEKGYGPVNPEAKQKVPLKAFGNLKGLKVGMIVGGNNNGNPVQARVLAIDKKDVTLDLNHPLAGKTLNFDIEIVAIGAAPAAPEPAPAPQQ